MNTYPLGNTVPLSVVFRDVTTLVPVDPTKVLLRVGDPSGVEVDYVAGDIVRKDIGVYEVAIMPRLPGIWGYRWEGTGAIVAADEGQFEVRPSLFRTLHAAHLSDTGRYVAVGALTAFARS